MISLPVSLNTFSKKSIDLTRSNVQPQYFSDASNIKDSFDKNKDISVILPYSEVDNMYPKFSDRQKIRQIVRNIKSEMLDYALKAAKAHMGLKLDDFFKPESKPNIQTQEQLFKVALLAQKPLRVYAISRTEANEFLALAKQYSSIIDEIGKWLKQDKRDSKLTDYMIHEYIKSPKRTQIPAKEGFYPGSYTPVGNNTFIVPESDLKIKSEDLLKRDAKAFHTLHDTAHDLATQVEQNLYSCNFTQDVLRLPEYLQKIMKDNNYEKSSYFSYYKVVPTLLGAKESENYLKPEKSKQKIEDTATRWANFLAGKQAVKLQQQVQEQVVKLDKPVSPEELAILAQVRIAEGSSADLEPYQVFRGNNQYLAGKDPLENMSTSERIKAIAKHTGYNQQEFKEALSNWTMFKGLVKYANALLHHGNLSSQQKQLVEETIEALTFKFKDPENLSPVNLPKRILELGLAK